MNLEVTGVHHIMNTKGYADLLLRFLQTLEEIDRQEYADKLSIVQLLCTLNPQVLPPKGSGMCSPLQLALLFHHEKQLEFIQKIITHNVDVNERDDRGLTPLHYAVIQNPVPPRVIEIVKLLIENGADPDAVDQQGRTFLHNAPGFLTPELYDQLILFFDSSGRKDFLKLLSHHNHSLLHLAVLSFEPLPSTLNIFKSNGTAFNGQTSYGNSVVFLAIQGGRNAEFLSSLFTYGADWKMPNKKQENALHVAALCGNVSALELFIALRCDVNAKNIQGRTPLHNAFVNAKKDEKQFKMIQLLISHKVDVNEPDSEGYTSLHYAVTQKPVPPRVIDIVKLLMENGADPDAVDGLGRTFLHWAPWYLTPELYDQLIVFFDSTGRKDSLKLSDFHNWSHLHHAVHNFDPLLTTLDIFKWNGIDFNGQDNDGDCVVFDAIEGGRNADFLHTLFTYGADWRIPDKSDNNALHLAALFGNVSALKLFISLGCDVNGRNIDGLTPLHNAFLGKKRGEDIMTEHEIVVMLLRERVDVTAKDTYGKTPIDLAKERLKIGKVKQGTVYALEKYSSK